MDLPTFLSTDGFAVKKVNVQFKSGFHFNGSELTLYEKMPLLLIGSDHLKILPQTIINMFPGLTGYNERDRITSEELKDTNHCECKRLQIM